MADPVRRLPVLLEGVDADLPGGTDVGVKYLCCEPTYTQTQKSTSRGTHDDRDGGGGGGNVHFGGAAGNSSVNLNFTLK